MTSAPPRGGEDVVSCADEPIRVPGSVQPHGVLLAAEGPDREIVMVSASSADHLGRPPASLLGTRLGDLIGADALPALVPGEDGMDPRPVTIALPGGERREFDALAHHAQDVLVVELEPRTVEPAAAARRTRTALRALQSAGTVEQLSATLAREIRDITGFDRVMVYRFDREWNGEVVAEDRRTDLEPFLGLHYPASDIPAQARELYRTQWLRSIPDAGYAPSPLEPALLPRTGAPLDLSGSALRSVSPVHLQYLANMGVRASMSVSLIVHGRLWGLIACHHYDGPHYPSPTARTTAEFLGRTASLLLQGKDDEAHYVESLAITAASADLVRGVAASIRDPLRALTDDDAVLHLMDGAGGAAVRIDNELRLVGTTPGARDVVALADLLWPDHSRPVVSHRLARDLPGELTEQVREVASGVLAVRLTAGGSRDFLIWFRPEVLQEVAWAGDPHTKGFESTPEGLRLTPRASFATWVEQVRGTSEPWEPAQAGAAAALARDVDDLLARRKAEDERVAAALQRIVLTERPRMPEGYSLEQRYEPSGTDVLGGDWYDVTALPDGRTVLMVGDVAGHGITVAAITAQVRHALRAYLINEGSASLALSKVNELISTLLPGELATAVAAELDPATGEVRLSRAGHLPALHLHDGTADLVGMDTHGAALGVRVGDNSFPETRFTMEHGDCLLLFSDGLVESRGTAISTSLDQLRARALEIGCDAAALTDGLLAAAPDAGDDVTLVVLQRH